MAKGNKKAIAKGKKAANVTGDTKDVFSVELGIGDLATKLRTEAMGMRMSTMSRFRDLIRRKVENIPFDKPEAKKDKEAKLKDQDKYKDTELPKFLATLKEEKKLNATEMKRISTALDMISDIKALEKRCVTDLIEPYIKTEEMWYAYYKYIKGVGPTLAAELLNSGMQPAGLKEDGTEICPHVSSLRRYCMMDPDGAVGRKAGHKLTGNIAAKTLWWKIAQQMAMAKNEMYVRLYDEAKSKQINMLETCKCKTCDGGVADHKRNKEKYKDTKYHCKDGKVFAPTMPAAPMSKEHAHLRAQRSAIQKFITWHWIISRQLAGFPTDHGYIFEGAEKPHDLSGFINPSYIPEILFDENGNWSPKRPAGWIFQAGHKNWNKASDYVKTLCNVTAEQLLAAPSADLKKEAEAVIEKLSMATKGGKASDVTPDELQTLKQWIYEQERAKKNVQPVQSEIKKIRGRPPKTLKEAQENPIEAMKMLRQKETTAPTMPPKKRGRPRKDPTLIQFSGPKSKEDTIGSFGQGMNEPIKKKRGRPRKDATKDYMPDDNPGVDEQVKKKRGRPRKELIATNTEPTVKRKRGRPRKEA